MRKLGALATVVLAALAIWLASTGTRQGSGSKDDGSTVDSAYDYEAREVLVRQMGPDGTLQYELEAAHIAQLPSDGQIAAEDVVIRHYPEGASSGSNAWTLTAQKATLPEGGEVISLQGQVRVRGRTEPSQASITLATEQLTYDIQSQEVLARTPVDFTWSGVSLHCGSLRANIRQGTFGVNGTSPVESRCHGTILP